MTKKIHLLEPHIINQIAAGEVIENPSSVVKELVENALDAGASSITIEIVEGGRELIRISDNGCGMSQEDALSSLQRHATSKITYVEDIEEIATMGFRGEAIPSIASISKFSLLTAEKEGPATFIFVEGGKILSSSEAVRDPGTTIEVKSLFYNVPVRRKFQKSPSYDTQEIIKMVSILSLSRPDVQFHLIGDEKSLFQTCQLTSDSKESVKERFQKLIGDNHSNQLIAVDSEEGKYQIKGWISKPENNKPNRSGQFIFINERAVTCPLIASSVAFGYSTLLPARRYPLFTLHLTLPKDSIDVNVHPQKKEVRIREEAALKAFLLRSIQKALRANSSFQRASFEQKEQEPPPFWGASSYSFSMPEKSVFIQEACEETYFTETKEPVGRPFTMETFSLPPPEWQPLSFQEAVVKPPKILATIADFILIDSSHLEEKLFGTIKNLETGGLALIDQRAAYARIQFERLLKGASKTGVQSLLIPLSFETTPQESALIKENLEILNELGFSIREFGASCFLIDAYPSFIEEKHIENSIQELIESLVESDFARKIEKTKEEKLALFACRTTLWGKKCLSFEEAEELVKQLLECKAPHLSPVGKQTACYLSPKEVSKLFA